MKSFFSSRRKSIFQGCRNRTSIESSSGGQGKLSSRLKRNNIHSFENHILWGIYRLKDLKNWTCLNAVIILYGSWIFDKKINHRFWNIFIWLLCVECKYIPLSVSIKEFESKLPIGRICWRKRCLNTTRTCNLFIEKIGSFWSRILI